MPWKPLPQIAFAVAIFPFVAQEPADLPLELGDELYIIEQGGYNDEWLRGYLLAPPSLLAGLTSSKGQTLESRVFSGIFPRSCVEVREILAYDDANNTGVDSPNVVSEDAENEIHGALDLKSHIIIKRVSSIKLSDRTWNKTQRLTSDKNFCDYTTITSRSDVPKPQAPVPMLKVGDEIPTLTDEPLVDEIASCLREWHSTYLHQIILAGDYQRLGMVTDLVKSLDAARKQLLCGLLTKQELVILRQKVVWEMVQGNKLFGGEVIVRDPAEQGRILVGDDSIFNVAQSQIMMSLLEEQPCLGAQDNSTLFHLLADLKNIASRCTQNIRYVFLLASKAPDQAVTILSESYVLSIPQNEPLSALTKMELARTLFTDLSGADIGDSSAPDSEIYLIVKRQNLHEIIESEQSSRTTSRDGKLTRTPPQTIGPAGKTGRRSFMWGNKPHKNITFRPPSSARAVRETFSRQSRGQDSSVISSHSNGSIVNENNSEIQTIYRTAAIGAVKINDMFKRNEEVDQMIHLIHLWAAGPSSHDDRVYSLEEVIQRLNNPSKSQKPEHLQVHLKSFSSSNSKELIKRTPSLLSGIVATKKMGFSNSTSDTKSDIFLVIEEAFLPHQVFLTRATGGATPLSQNMTGLNLQISLEVRNSRGEILTGCIYPYSNSEVQSTWESVVTKKGEPWKQNLRLAIPTSEVPTSHLVLTLTDLPNTPFAVSYMPLWDHDVFLPDGDHSLLLYSYDEMTNVEYLSYPWCAKNRDDISTDEVVTGPIANLRVQTYLGSTRLLQDKVLASLLKWKELPDVQVQKFLKRLLFVPDVEIVKLLDNVLDALFGILVEKSGDEYGDLTFNALVTVLGIIHDRRFNMGVLVDQYTKLRFYYPFATPCLLRSFTRLLAKPSDPDTSQQLRATFKVFKYILKFITRSSDQQKEKEAEIGITSSSPLPRHLKSIFKAFYRMMHNEDAILVGSKTLAVQHFHTWLPELTSLLSKEDIINIAIDFMDSCASVKGKLILYKMVLIINYSKIDIFSRIEDKRVLCINTVRWIAPYWGKTDEVDGQWRDQIRLCCSIISCQAEDLTYEISDYVLKIVESYAYILTAPKPVETENMRLSFLFPKTYPFPSKPISASVIFDEALIELSTVLSAMSMLPDGMKLEHEQQTDELAKLLEEMLNVYLSILNCDAYPKIWLSLHIYHHKAILVALDYISRILQLSFIPDPDNAESYNTELWQIYFTVLFKLVGSDELALETFPEQKRRVVWQIAGDVRGAGAELMQASWEMIGWETSAEERKRYGLLKIGGYQVQYVPCLIGPIVELCLSVHKGLRKVAVEILQTMIISEWILSEDISIIQTEMIDSLDQIFKTKPLSESILQKLFIDELKDLFYQLSSIPDDSLYAAIQGLLITVSEFLDLLVAVHGSDVTSEAANITNRLRLMEFLRDIQKEEILIRNIHQLAHLHSEAGNSTGAGLSLRLHADLYDWDPTRVLPALSDPNFPSQTHFERKECLYFEMIKFFEDGEAWSSAIVAYEELQIQYQKNIFDFQKLSRTFQAIGSIYETIAKSDKTTPRYFRVVYRGLGFPPSLRDKQFVFEGYPNETLAIFQDRIQAFHPSAQIITTNDTYNVEGQFLQIFVLSPYRDLNHSVLQRTKVPQTVRDYLMFSFPQTFSITQKCNTSGPITEHTMEKTLYKTVDRFPTLLRYSEIESVSRQSMSVLETAVERVIRKTAEMTMVVKRLLSGDIEIAPILIEVLQTSVNPSSDSTVSRYRSLLPGDFLNEDNELQTPELTALENALKTALIDYALTVRRCLTVFSQPGTKSLLSDPERELLIQGFESTFAPELTTYAFLQPSDVRNSKSVTWSLLWPYSPSISALSNSQTKVSSVNNVRSTFGTGNSDPCTKNSGRKRQSIFHRRQERREDSTGNIEPALKLAPSPMTKTDESFGIRSKKTKTTAITMIRNRGTSGSISSQRSQSTRYSLTKENSISIREEDMSRRMRFMRTGTLSRSSHRKEHSELRSQSELGYRSSTKRRQNFRDTIHGDSQLIAKGGFGRVTGGVKNTFNFVGLGLGRKKSISGLTEQIVSEES